jgi:hypothetical protein
MVSGKIDVVADPGLSGVLEESQEPSALGDAASAPYDHDDPRMRMDRRESKEMIPVTCHQYGLFSVSEGEKGGIVGITRKQITESRNGLSCLRRDASDRLRDIIVEQEGHAIASAIWRAIR